MYNGFYLVVNTEKGIDQMSQMFEKILERLAEMFPEQSYQTRLEQYLGTKGVQSASDVEYWQRQYDKQSNRNLI